MLSGYHHWVKGLDPVADAFAGTVYTDIFKLADYNSATALIYWGVGATGTTTITVEACDDVSGSNVQAIEFKYKRIASADTQTALTTATTAGFLTTAGSSQIYIVEIDSDQLGDTGYKFCRLKFVEGTDSPILGGVLIMLNGPRYAQSIPATAIA